MMHRTANEQWIFRLLRGDVSTCLFLTVITLLVFWNVQQFGFVYDDSVYVTENTHVQSGLNPHSIKWAFTSIDGGSYHPLTWLSWMGDYELYGLNAAGYHWTNLLIHIGNVLLLFLFLRRATGDVFCSSFASVLFAIHPLHVESVAWVSERKDTLSTFFWMLTMGAYLSYTEHHGWGRYLMVVLFFVLGLMSKPMLVTLPFVLLLLDYWPLKRIQFFNVERYSTLLKLIYEKAPLILLSIAFSALTLYSQKKAGAVILTEALPWTARIMNAIVSYATYIEKMIWPKGLAAFYPYRRLLLYEELLSFLALIVISLVVVKHWRKRPYLAVGWLWYLGTIVPVIGIVQVGMQAMADRYTYVPMIGLFVMITWCAADLFENRTYGKTLLAICALSFIIFLAIQSRVQVSYWQNSITLFSHALDISPNNHLAHSNLGVALKEKGDYLRAIEHFQEAIRIKPSYAIAHDNLGSTYILQGRLDDGIRQLREAFRLDPYHRLIQRNLADAIMMKKEFNEAVEFYKKLLSSDPDNAELYNNLGVALTGQGKINEAVICFENALRISPDYIQARVNLDKVIKNIH